ncbi:hypothetical protein NDU88_005865 [Pleurodeles waltl]|uniref:Uncharacterized protein n=1 Tax=Pleurodeles waltl TaxID=8319 RepID=A0AAV7LQ99_PLEWA|nr:hypothetical protein NDU88_005865 [Pleurodeles waltl]
MACASPEHTSKKFSSKSVSARKVMLSPERGLEGPAEVSSDLLVVVKQVQSGGVSFARHSGASFRQRVVTRGRGASQHGAVTGLGRLGKRPGGAQALAVKRTSKRRRVQAPSPFENSGERREHPLEERSLGGACKMAAPTDASQDSVVIISEDEGEG